LKYLAELMLACRLIPVTGIPSSPRIQNERLCSSENFDPFITSAPPATRKSCGKTQNQNSQFFGLAAQSDKTKPISLM